MKQYKKAYYIIRAEKVAPGTHLYNYLEDCHYETTEEKCIRLIGTADEEWPVTIKKLAATYTYVDGSRITAENIPAGVFAVATIVDADAPIYFAEQTKEQVKVITSWGEVLTANRDGVPHGDGDYIICSAKDGQPNEGDRWVINGLVFNKTYVEA